MNDRWLFWFSSDDAYGIWDPFKFKLDGLNFCSKCAKHWTDIGDNDLCFGLNLRLIYYFWVFMVFQFSMLMLAWSNGIYKRRLDVLSLVYDLVECSYRLGIYLFFLRPWHGLFHCLIDIVQQNIISFPLV